MDTIDVDHIFEVEICQDEHEQWRACHHEPNTSVCAQNRKRRMKAINIEVDDEADKLFKNWRYVRQKTRDEYHLCLCGHMIMKEYTIRHEGSGFLVVLGSDCIQYIHDEFGGGEAILAELDWHCEKCNERKDKKTARDPATNKRVKLPYCGGSFCKIRDRCICGGSKREIDLKCGGEICLVERQRAEIRELERELREAAEREWRRTHCEDCKEPKSPDDQFCGGDRCEWDDYHCSFCREGKDPGNLYCEGLFCGTCKHGQRVNRKGVGKTGKSYDAWFCPCTVRNGQKCEPIWINRGRPNIPGTPHR